ncbi:hypothetical protein P4495_32850, partial [Bacillus thuringiensis]|nr:hypothetical protein [Bacillus thuringiensis]
TGPTGATGSAGATGPTGATGPNFPTTFADLSAATTQIVNSLSPVNFSGSVNTVMNLTFSTLNTITIIDTGIYKAEFYISFEPTTDPVCFIIGPVGSTNTAGNIALLAQPNGSEISVSRIMPLNTGDTLQVINVSDSSITLPALSITTDGRVNARFVVYRIF